MTGDGEKDQRAPKEDRKQIGLPKQASELLDEIVSKTPWFAHALDAYRLAIGVALAKGLQPAKEGADSYDTKYGTSSVDQDGDLRELVLALAPECEGRPYDYAQRLANKGVYYLHNELVKKGRPLATVLGAQEKPEDA